MVRGVCVVCVCVCVVCVCVCLFRLCHTQKNVDVTRVHVTPKNQRFRETEGFEPAREAEGFSSTPRRPMGHAQLYSNLYLPCCVCDPNRID